MTTERDDTYKDFKGVKDLRHAQDVREKFIPSYLTDEPWDLYKLPPEKLKPGRVLRVMHGIPRDTYGYWAMFALGFASGAITILCSVGR